MNNDQRKAALKEISDIRTELVQQENWFTKEEIKDAKLRIRKLLRYLKDNTPIIHQGGTYTLEQFSDSLAWNGKNEDAPIKRLDKFFEKDLTTFFKQSDIEAREHEQMIVKEIIRYNPGVHNYIMKMGGDFMNAEKKKIHQEVEKVEDSSIYAKMSAKTITTFESSFQIFLPYNPTLPLQLPITIISVYDQETTLRQSDIRSFM